MKIAIFMNENSEMVNFYDCTGMTIYEKVENGFELSKIISYQKIEPKGPKQIRSAVGQIFEKMGDCNVAVFGSISGIPYTVFDMKGYRIFQMEKFSEEMLKYILDDLEELEKNNQELRELANMSSPIETDIPGEYFFDLIKAQEMNPEMSSKKAIRDFLDNTPFMELKLVCAHVPPWIESDGRYKVKIEKIEKGFLALIRMA